MNDLSVPSRPSSAAGVFHSPCSAFAPAWPPRAGPMAEALWVHRFVQQMQQLAHDEPAAALVQLARQLWPRRGQVQPECAAEREYAQWPESDGRQAEVTQGFSR